MASHRFAKADHQVVIIGAGMSGLCMGMKLLDRGMDDFVILEKSPSLGGTGDDNSYPGACSDVPSLLYSYSFAPNPDWSRKFSPHKEIKVYLQRCAERFGLLPKLRFTSVVSRADWREDAGHWELRLEDGTMLTTRTLVSTLGPVNRPHIPDFPGRERFAGHSFHSERWDHDCDLTGKRVAVVGNAASALHFIPPVARQAQQLYVYQRSANYVMKRNDRAYQDWEKSLFRRVPLVQKTLRALAYLRGEWVLYPVRRRSSSWLLKRWERRWREYLEEEVADPALREKLTPDYRLGCKRILVSDDYYGAFRRDTVELVTSPVTGMMETGIETEDAQDRQVDVVIYATGFDTSQAQSGVDFLGQEGVSLNAALRDGAQAYRGVCASGFPNFFRLYAPHTDPGSHSLTFMIERQVAWVVNCIDKLLVHELRALTVNPRVERAYNARMQAELSQTAWAANAEVCDKDAAGRMIHNWPHSTLRYWWHMRSPDFTDFDMRA